jgi:hypothetical protein
MRKRTEYSDRIFLAGDCVYMRDPSGTWFQTGSSGMVYGFKCPGSIDVSKNPAFSGDHYDVEEFSRQLLRGPPEGFAPYFEKDRYPLFLFSTTPSDYRFIIGPKITEVYKEV